MCCRLYRTDLLVVDMPVVGFVDNYVFLKDLKAAANAAARAAGCVPRYTHGMHAVCPVWLPMPLLQ